MTNIYQFKSDPLRETIGYCNQMIYNLSNSDNIYDISMLDGYKESMSILKRNFINGDLKTARLEIANACMKHYTYYDYRIACVAMFRATRDIWEMLTYYRIDNK